jgi:formylglycine-generating enzyme required for sulfatase activity
MKLNNLATFLTLAFAAVVVASCGSKSGASSGFGSGKKSAISNTTGWRYNDEKATGFGVKKNYKPQVPTGMIAIEGGTFTIGEKGEVVTGERNNLRRRITVMSFYMDQYEISNVNWREYTHWMKTVFQQTAPRLVERTQPNAEVWREPLAYNEPLLEHYFTHPAFDEYPIVGVT